MATCGWDPRRRQRMAAESYGVIMWIKQTKLLHALNGWITQCVYYITIKMSSTYKGKKNHKNLLCDGLWGRCEEAGKATAERVGGMWLPQGFSSAETRGWQAAFHTSSRLHDAPDPAPLSHRKSWRKTTFSRQYFLLDSISNSERAT